LDKKLNDLKKIKVFNRNNKYY